MTQKFGWMFLKMKGHEFEPLLILVLLITPPLPLMMSHWGMDSYIGLVNEYVVHECQVPNWHHAYIGISIMLVFYIISNIKFIFYIIFRQWLNNLVEHSQRSKVTSLNLYLLSSNHHTTPSFNDKLGLVRTWFFRISVMELL
jgi:hypothetical protein